MESLIFWLYIFGFWRVPKMHSFSNLTKIWTKPYGTKITQTGTYSDKAHDTVTQTYWPESQYDIDVMADCVAAWIFIWYKDPLM